MCARIRAPLSGTRTHQRQRFSPVETAAHGRSQLSARHREPTRTGGETKRDEFSLFLAGDAAINSRHPPVTH